MAGVGKCCDLMRDMEIADLYSVREECHRLIAARNSMKFVAPRRDD
jgi:hypothetical protein